MQKISITLNRNGLSDPFKPKSSQSNQETKKFYEEITKNVEGEKYRAVKENDNILSRLIKNSLNPTPINISFRQRFKLDDNYRLVYLIDRERLHLIIFGLMNLLFPIFIVTLGLLAYTELTGRSQIPETAEDPYLFLGALSAYFLLIFSISRMVQSRTVLRIYYNEKLNKFVLIKLRGILNFKNEEFISKNVIYKQTKHQNKMDNFVQNITKTTGNVYINNKIRRIDFNQFSSAKIIEKMFGTEIFNLIKLEMNKNQN